MRWREYATFCAGVIFLKSGAPLAVFGNIAVATTAGADAACGFAASFAFVADAVNDTVEPVPA